MFKDKFEFKRDFTQRVVESYGRSVEQSHRTERYMVLGEMVRDYASIHWKQNKETIAQIEAKQMFYFSMEFLAKAKTASLFEMSTTSVNSFGFFPAMITVSSNAS